MRSIALMLSVVLLLPCLGGVARAQDEKTEPAAGTGVKARFCPSCGTKFEESWRFCPNCGKTRPTVGGGSADRTVPINPFAGVAKDDWAFLSGTFTTDATNERARISIRDGVTDVSGDAVVVVELQSLWKDRISTRRSFSTTTRASLEEFFGIEGAIRELRIADETRTVSGREFACKKVSFRYDPAPGTRTVVAWLSADVKASGVVALSVKGEEKGPTGLVNHTDLELEVVGWGSGEEATWGRTPGDALPDDEVSGDENPWKVVPIGRSYEFELKTEMKKPVAMTSKMTMRQTLKARDDREATIETEVTVAGTTMPPTEQKIPLDAPVRAGEDGATAPVDLGEETIRTPAGTFACRHLRVESEINEQTTTTDMWMARGVPMPVKSVTTNENLTSTIVLTRIKKK